MKKEKGITLISLIVTLIVLLIITNTAIFGGIYIFNVARKSKFMSEIELVQGRVNVIHEENKNNVENYTNFGQNIEGLSQEIQNRIIVAFQGKNQEGFRYFNNEDLEYIGIEDLKKEFLINLDTREIISVSGVELNGTTYYTLRDLSN